MSLGRNETNVVPQYVYVVKTQKAVSGRQSLDRKADKLPTDSPAFVVPTACMYMGMPDRHRFFSDAMTVASERDVELRDEDWLDRDNTFKE